MEARIVDEVAGRFADGEAKFPEDGEAPEVGACVDRLKEKYGGGKSDFVWKIRDFQDLGIERRRNGFALSTVVSGPWGKGKTQFTMQAAKPPLDVNYKVGRNMIFARDGLGAIKLIDAMDNECAPVVDELIQVLYKMDFAEEESKFFIKYITTHLRKNKKGSFFGNIPSTADFNNTFMRSCIDLWVKILAPGVGVIFMKDETMEIGDPFYKDLLAKRWLSRIEKEHMPVEQRNTNLDYQLDFFSKHNTFFRMIEFPPVSKEEYVEYMRIFTADWEVNKAWLFKSGFERRESRKLAMAGVRVEEIVKRRREAENTINTKAEKVWGCGCVYLNGVRMKCCEGHMSKNERIAKARAESGGSNAAAC